jgi:hypothetical protein
MKRKKLDRVMKAISKAYDADGIVWQYYEHSNGNFGDTLAQFIAIECKEVSEGSESVVFIRQAMFNALNELENVVDALSKIK